MLFTAIFAFLGQWAKSHPKIANWIPQSVMMLAGLAWYSGNHGFPKPAAHEWQALFAAWTDWLEAAMLSAAAIPGAASLLSLIPAMKTRAQPNP